MPPIFVSKNGQQVGPYTLAQIDQLLQSETFTGEDLYWHQGASGWRPISQLPGYVPPPSSGRVPPPKATPPAPCAAPAPPLPAEPVSKPVVDPLKLKHAYVDRMRANSNYPTFRSLVDLFVFLIYIVGALWILGGLIAGIANILKGHDPDIISGVVEIIIGLIGGTIYIIIGKVLKEVSLMLADIADTLLDYHSQFGAPK